MRPALNGSWRRFGWSGAAMLLLSVAALSLVVSAQNAPLTLVSTAWPPFTGTPGQPRFALDLVETGLSRLGYTATTGIVEAAKFNEALLTGPFDGSAAAWRDQERERVLLYSQPYLQNRLVLVGRAGADVSAKTLADLKGRRVAIVEGYSYGETIDNAGPTFVRSSSEEDSLSRLLKGGADYTLMDELVVQHVISSYPKESETRLEIGTIPLVTRDLYLAVRRTRVDAESIIKGFNAQLRGMISDRTYHRLLHVDWIMADVNGDGTEEFVPASDQAGPLEPQRAYSLFSGTATLTPNSEKPGFYVGGNIYSDWASVPQTYKANSDRPDPRRSTASIFKFTW